ncbi:MAG TPA: hypothetical protein VF572_05175 [Candidatus Saccharimonadales bacterium]
MTLGEAFTEIGRRAMSHAVRGAYLATAGGQSRTDLAMQRLQQNNPEIAKISEMVTTIFDGLPKQERETRLLGAQTVLVALGLYTESEVSDSAQDNAV